MANAEAALNPMRMRSLPARREGERERAGVGLEVRGRVSGQLGTVSELGSWCFEPCQPLGIISGLKETFIKRYIVERTNKVEIKPEEQSEKAKRRVVGRMYGMKYS